MARKRKNKPKARDREGDRIFDQVMLYDSAGNLVHQGADINDPPELVIEDSLSDWKDQLRDSDDVQIIEM